MREKENPSQRVLVVQPLNLGAAEARVPLTPWTLMSNAERRRSSSKRNPRFEGHVFVRGRHLRGFLRITYSEGVPSCETFLRINFLGVFSFGETASCYKMNQRREEIYTWIGISGKFYTALWLYDDFKEEFLLHRMMMTGV